MGPKLRLIGTPEPIEVGSKSLTTQDTRMRAKASFLFWPIDSIPIDEAPFDILQERASNSLRKYMVVV